MKSLLVLAYGLSAIIMARRLDCLFQLPNHHHYHIMIITFKKKKEKKTNISFIYIIKYRYLLQYIWLKAANKIRQKQNDEKR